jgi:Carboxypeptidase regulatory-like domain/TonB dependent receptor
MENRRTLRRVVVALVLLVAFLSQGTWALAGTTGGLSGQVLDDKGAPVAGAAVKVSSPSQTASATTDAGGHFSFLSLAPDTYSVTASKDGFQPASYPGISIFADQTLTLAVSMQHTGLKQIASVTARGQGSLVKPGTTVDVYAVNATTATALQTIGGGNNLDSSYSAIYAQPGVNALPGNFGFGQIFYIHGSSYNQIGYEFDGIPVNRAFDNYNASSLSNLGVVSTEVYTGGGPAAGTAATLGGYIDQVIKTGTYPGYIDGGAGIGAPGFYHQAQIEAGGATPDRNFSYYVALRGVNSIPNQLDASNGSDLNPNGNNPYAFQSVGMQALLFPLTDFGVVGSGRGPFSQCVNNGYKAPAGSATLSPAVMQYYGVGAPGPTCIAYNPILGGLTTSLRGNQLTDRENVINLHFGIPHHNDSGKDDVQILYDNFYYLTTAWDNLATNGGTPFINNVLHNAGIDGGNLYSNLAEAFTGAPLPAPAMPQFAGLCAYYNFFASLGYSNPCPSTGYSPSPWGDAYQIKGATFGQSALGKPNIVQPYFFPSSPTDRLFGSGLPADINAGTGNNGSIVKLQYQKNFGSNAYLRVYGYTFYSDWLMNDPNTATYNVSPYNIGGGSSGDYELNTHTGGGGLQFADQLNAQNLVTLSANYTTAQYMRYNNAQTQFSANGTPIASLVAGNTCYSAESNNPTNKAGGPRIDNSYSLTLPLGSPVSCLSALAGATVNGVQGGALAPAVGMGAAAGASWQLTQNLQPDANRNTVSPRFTTVALQDEFRPSDRWDINLGVRFESYGYVLGNFDSPEAQFWFNQVNSTVCVDPLGLQQVDGSVLTGQSRYGGVAPSFPTYYTTAPGQPCMANPQNGDKLYHPGQNGVPQITLGGSGTITNTTWSPRVGFTYTVSPNSVIRFSYGRYTQPTPTADEQVLTYLDGYQMANNLYNSSYYNNGYSSIVHNNPIQFSNNFDASYEAHVNGTDWSYKVSPFSRWTTNQSVSVSLPGGLAGAFNSGTQKTTGVELAIQKGDASRNGLSGQLSYTYTFSQLKYTLINGSNIVSNTLSELKNFTSLEKSGGGFACYGSPATSQAQAAKICAADAASGSPKYVANPYYNMNISYASLQAQLPLTGFYPTYANYFPYGLQQGDGATALAPNIFSGFLSYKHNKLTVGLTGQLWEGTQYGAPGEISGLDPRFCAANQNATGYTPGSQLADYQSCQGNVAIPNPTTGAFDGIGQYRNPWDLNLGAQIAYSFTPRIQGTIALANILNACFGGSAEPWTAQYAPNRVICAYAPSGTYLGWSPNEVYNTAGAGYFYGNSPHAKQNGTAGYSNLFNQAYVPTTSQISSPFQAYFQVQVKL